jgi:DNA-binding NtrC family response regulator
MKILIVEDHSIARLALKGFLKEHEVDIAQNFSQAQKSLAVNHYDLAFLDLDLGEDEELAGLELAKICKEKNLYSVILTGHEEDEIIKRGYSSGAKDYIAKPVTQKKIDDALNGFVVFDSQDRIDDLIKSKYVTTHKETLAELETIKRVALSDQPILIKGPSGTGKTIVANLIKEACKVPDDKFFSINCASIGENLLESELFGHKKGSFTDAKGDKIGLLEKADGGIVFLDEIHSLSLRAQQKLMKAIDDKKFFPVGSTKEVQSNFRVISATCEDLLQLIIEEEFRADFYARISHIQLKLFALKDRPQDILPLVKFYASKYSRKFTLTDEAKKRLLTLPFDNNIRDIDALMDYWNRNAIGVVEAKDIPAQFLPMTGASKKVKLTKAHKMLIKEEGLKGYLDMIRDEVIQHYLELNNGHRIKTAQDLKITDRTIRYALKRNMPESYQMPLEVENENYIH